MLLGHHGMSSWSNDDKTCYETALEIIDRATAYIEARDKGERTFGGPRYAALAGRRAARACSPRSSRGCAGRSRSSGASSARSRTTRRCCASSSSVDGAAARGLGTSCPDHFLRTKIKPLFVDWDPATRDLDALKAIARARASRSTARDYAAYYERHKRPGLARRCATRTRPSCSIPGLGMIAWGKNKSESRVTAEFYNCAIEVMRGAEAIDRYEAMDPQEAFDIEYWSLEEAKLRRLPPEKELDRQIVVVVGAGAGIGKATAHRLVKEGAHVVCVDRDGGGRGGDGGRDRRDVRRGHRRRRHRASATAARRSASRCDITDRASVARMLREARPRLRRPRRRGRHGGRLRARRTRTAASTTSSGR